MKKTLLFGFMLMVLSLNVKSQTTITLQTISSADDAWEKDNGDMKIDDDQLELGEEGLVGLRFENVTLPSNAIINSAVIQFTASHNENKNPSSLNIFGQAAPNPINFLSADNDLSNRSTTSDSTIWNFASSWTKDFTYDSPDISNVIQELVDQNNWYYENAMVLILEATGSETRKAYAYDNDPLKSTKLIITYTGGFNALGISAQDTLNWNAAEANAIAHSDSSDVAQTTALETYTDQAEADAITTANQHSDSSDVAQTIALQNYADQSEADAITTANQHSDDADSAQTIALENYTDQAEANAINAANAYTDAEVATQNANSELFAEQEAADALATSIQHSDAADADQTIALQAYSDQAEADAIAASNQHSDAADVSQTTALETYTDQAEADAVNSANTYTNTENVAQTAALQAYSDQAEADAFAASNQHSDAADVAQTTALETYTDQAEADAVNSANTYTNTENVAQTAALQAYSDQAEADAIAASNQHSDAADVSQTTALETYTDQAEADAVNSANTYTNTENVAQTAALQAYSDQAEADAIAASNLHSDAADVAQTTALENYTDQAEADAIAAANQHSDDADGAQTTALEAYADQAETDAINTANAYTDTANYTQNSALETYADQVEADAIAAANQHSDDADLAQTTALEAYADQAEADAIASANAHSDGEDGIQNLAIANNTNNITTHISLDGDMDANNEIQNLTITGDELSISQGNTITIPGLSLVSGLIPQNVQTRLDGGESPLQIYNSDNALLDSLYSKTYAGGVIFHFDIASGEGLVARPEIVGGTKWGCFGQSINGADDFSVGAGLQNTLDIVNDCTDPNIVANISLNYTYDGYDDWFLPSKDEMDLLLEALKKTGFSPKFNTYVWSSTEVGSTNAYRVTIPGWKYTPPENEYNPMTWGWQGQNKQVGANLIPVRKFAADESPMGLHLIADQDLSSENELNDSINLNGNVLEISDAGGTLTVDLSNLQDGTGTDDQAISYDAGSHTLTLEDGGNVDLSDLANGAETDPVFEASPSYGILANDINNWNTAHSWGDHASAGYLTTEVDPQVGSNTNFRVPMWNGSSLSTGSIFSFAPQYSATGSVIGWQNTATGENSFAGGFNSFAFGTNAIAFGEIATADGANSVALGKGSRAQGSSSIAIGEVTEAEGYNSVAIGQSTKALAHNSVALGVGTQAASLGETAVGINNDNTGYNGNLIDWIPTDRIFVVGNGNNQTSENSNALVVLKNGNTGLGTSSPDAKLHVEGGSIKMVDGSEGVGKVLTSDADGLASWQTPVDNVDDSDNDPTNELQDWSNLPGIPADIADGDQVNDADSDPTNELQDWSNLPGIPADISDGDQVDDADADPTNEYNTGLELFGTSLQVFDNGGFQETDLSSLKDNLGNHTATQAIQLNNNPISNDGDYEGIFIDNDGHVGIATGASPNANLAVGGDALINNVWVGQSPGGSFSTRVGENALANNMANTNSAFGHGAMQTNTTGFDNTGLGWLSLRDNDTGAANTAVGGLALFQNTTGENNSALGYKSGETVTDGSSITLLGSFADVSNGSLVNATAVGAFAKAEQSNTVVLGSDADIGIGTGAPTAKLDVRGNVKIEDGTQAAGRVLTSDADGLASWQTPVDNVDDADNDAFNEIQTLSLSGNDLSISGTGGNTITLPIAPEVDPEVGTNTTNRVPVWDGAALVEGSLYSNGNTYSASGSAIGSDNTASGNNSTTIGSQNTASAEFSTALGLESSASGYGSTAIGLGAKAEGDFSLSMGLGGQASGVASITLGSDLKAIADYAIAMGRFSTASGGSATAMGYFTQASGEYSTTMGRQTDAWGQASTSLGWFTGAGGFASISMGNNTRAYADNSTAMGYYTVANGFATTSMGIETQAIAYGSTALGQFNVGSGNGAAWVDTDPVFEIGIGADNDNRDNAMTVLKNGDTGIGTSSPDAKLHVEGGSIKMADGSEGAGKVLTSDADGLASWQDVAAPVETDPDFNASPAASISSGDVSNWNAAYGWGDHTTAGYLSAEADPKVGTLSTNKVPNWNGTALEDGLIEDDGSQVSITNDALVNGITVGEGSTIGGTENTALGASALAANTSGWGSVAVGKNALSSNISSYGNTAVGWNALRDNINSENTAIGTSSLSNNTTGFRNVALGTFSMVNNTTGSDNNGLGAHALQNNTTGESNVGIGYNALFSNTTGFGNVAIGRSALENGNGIVNIAIGGSAMQLNQTGSENIAIGERSLFLNNTGYWNIAIGHNSMYSNESGIGNTAMGRYTLKNITSGVDNTSIGIQSMEYNTEGNNNAAFGGGSLRLNTTGEQNTAVGPNALTGNTTGTGNTAVGSGANVSSGNLYAATAIGFGALVSTSNSVVLGATNVNVGIGTSSPDARLHVAGGSIKMADGSEGSGKVLTSDADGLASWQDLPAAKGTNYGSEIESLEVSYEKLEASIAKQDRAIESLVKALDKKDAQIEALLNKIEQFDADLQDCCLSHNVSTEIDALEIDAPYLEQNKPNPFFNDSKIEYYIPAHAQKAQIVFYDVQGRMIKATDIKETGRGILTVKGGTLRAGTYFYKLVVDNVEVDTKKAIFME